MGRFITALFKKRKLEKRGFVNTYSRKKNKDDETRSVKKRPAFVVVSMLIIWGAFLYSFFSSRSLSSSIIFVEGQKANGNFYAAVEFSYEDVARTELLRKKVAEAVAPLFLIEQHKVDLTKKRFELLVKSICDGEKVSDSVVSTVVGGMNKEDLDSLKNLFANTLLVDSIKRSLTVEAAKGVGTSDMLTLYSSDRFGVIDNRDRKIYHSIDNFMTKKLVATRVTSYVSNLFRQPLANQSLLNQVLVGVITPNLQFDVAATEQVKNEKCSGVAPVMIPVNASEIVIPKGKILTENDVNKWRAYIKTLDTANVSFSTMDLIKFPVMSFLIISLFFAVIKFAYPRLIEKQAKLLLMFSVVFGLNFLLNILIHRLFIVIVERFGVNWDHPSFINVLLPVALGSILLTLLVDYRAGMFCCVMTAVMTGLMRYLDYLTVLNIIFVGAVACMFVNNARNRATINRACIMAVLVNVVVQFPYLMTEQLPSEFYLHLIGLAIAGLTILYFLVMVLLPVFEFLFGRTTNLSLLELCDLNHPLLQRLQMEAPGSYHHSLLVATIAEHACKAIGANSLLARVCAYFHDIGKIANSQYFTENNFESGNKHTELKAKMSSLVIMNHVKEGVNLALRYKLKTPILEAIEQHHGKSLVSYFYQIAKGETDEKYRVDDSEFRYPGPLPKRKEIVILSIADPCEAASRSLEKPTLKNIEALVNSIVEQRFADGHFARADITLKELEIVKHSITKTLSNMLHTRVAYPKDEKEENNETDTQQSGRELESDESGSVVEDSESGS